MKKSDLVAGKHVVQYRDGKFRFVRNDGLLFDSDGLHCHSLDVYDERLNEPYDSKTLDIVAVYELNEVWKREDLTISEDEKAILRNLPANYEWIARDEDSKLYIYRDKPEKNVDVWMSGRGSIFLYLFIHLFKMVKWEDDEPWKIEDLLKLDVKKDG